MKIIHERIKDNFPTVLITLLSIVQALALELLWNHIIDADYLFEPGLEALLWWMQVLATLIGVMLIWLVYAMNAMRFRWLPGTMESIFPFIVGIIQFIVVADLGPGNVGEWLVSMAVIFLMMVWSAQSSLRRARQDPDNEEFFADIEPATLADFFPQIFASCILIATGLYILFADAPFAVSVVAITASFGILLHQALLVRLFWLQTLEPGKYK